MWIKFHDSGAEWREWMRHWAELNRVGMSAIDALQVSRELQASNSSNRISESLRLVQQSLESGMEMVQAFSMGVKDLPLPVLTALQCAQASGNLTHALDTQLARWAKTSDSQQQLIRSLIYPVFVLLLSLACWLFMANLAVGAGATPTGPLHSSFNWAEYLMGGGATVLLLAWFINYTKPPQNLLHNKRIDPRPDLHLAAHFHLMACELDAGIDIVQALKPRHGNTQALNLFLSQVSRFVVLGMRLSEAMEQAGAPAFMTRQARMVEHTGNMAACFFLAAKVYDLRASRCIQRLQLTLPPLALGASAIVLVVAYQTHIAPLYANLGAM
ncbi:MAG TPA: type II secretion system F family protein [Limnobacter sp.]|nr:type II secretion system F family protein [Limnobacter sp.]